MRTLYAIVVRPLTRAPQTPAGLMTVNVIDPRNPGGPMIHLKKLVDEQGKPVRVLPTPPTRVHGRVHVSLVSANEEAQAVSHPGVRAEIQNVNTLDVMESDEIAGAIAAEALRAVVIQAKNERRQRIINAYFHHKAQERIAQRAHDRQLWAAARRHAHA